MFSASSIHLEGLWDGRGEFPPTFPTLPALSRQFCDAESFEQLQSDPRWQRLDREEDSLMGILAAEMADPGSTGIGVDLDSIHD